MLRHIVHRWSAVAAARGPRAVVPAVTVQPCRPYYTSGVAPEPFQVLAGKRPEIVDSPEHLLGKVLQPKQTVFIHGGAATPRTLTDAMPTAADHHHLHDIEVCHIHTEGSAAYKDHPAFRTRNWFVGPNMRDSVNKPDGRAEYVPVFLSEVPRLIRRGEPSMDVALITVSPPDRHGYCSLGVSVDVARAAIVAAPKVVAQVNAFMPRTFGDGVLHVSHLDAVLEDNVPLPELKRAPPSEQEEEISRIIAEHLVEDGCTLQMGIGAIPDGVLSKLMHHKDLGVHSEMVSDGVMHLVEHGVVTNTHKRTQRGRVGAGFAMGSAKLYASIDDSPAYVFKVIDYINSANVAANQPKLTAINSAVAVDLTGQAAADSIGQRTYSGVGGQVDFIRAASLSRGGKPIIALPSRTHKGIPRIVPAVNGPVVTSRAHMHWVVTEYGAVNLWGMSLRERAKALIGIAHPEDRDWLTKEASDRCLL